MRKDQLVQFAKSHVPYQQLLKEKQLRQNHTITSKQTELTNYGVTEDIKRNNKENLQQQQKKIDTK